MNVDYATNIQTSVTKTIAVLPSQKKLQQSHQLRQFSIKKFIIILAIHIWLRMGICD